MGSDDAEKESRIPAGLSAREFALVARLPIFTGLDQARTRRLLDHALVRSFGRSAVLFLQDEPATRFYVILDGWVRLYRQTSEGQESTIAVYARGDSFAEAAILQSGAVPVTAVVIDDARLLVIEAEPFLRHLRADPKLCLNMMASMSNHLRRLVQQVEQLTVRSSTERLGDFLLRLVPAGDAGGAVVRLPLDKAMIAARLGMQPETLSRALARLRPLGIETRGSRVTIHNLEMLRRFVADRRGGGSPGRIRTDP
jgi:CRP-like cAMP-binding protein